METNVLIAGAGPVGLTLATALAGRGVDAMLVDRRTEVAGTSRAAVIHARTLEALEQIKVSDELVANGIVVPRFTVRDRDRALLTIDFRGLPTAYPYTLMLPQDETERILTDRLHQAGGTVRRGTGLAAMAQDAEGVTATLDDGQTVRAATWSARTGCTARCGNRAESGSAARRTRSPSYWPTSG